MTEAMVVSGILLVFTFIGIFSEHFHGIERAKFAMAGAGAMIISGQIMGFYSPELALQSIDWNVVFLLAIMMTIVSMMVSTGGFERLAGRLTELSGGSSFLLMVLLGTAVTLISLLLDNVTTVIIFGPLIILLCQKIKLSPVPYLLAIALLSDTGGVATLVGDPPNLMIGSAAGIDFNTFFIHMGIPVFLAWITILVVLRFLFRKEFGVRFSANVDVLPDYRNKRLWYQGLAVLGVMIILFVIHRVIGWEPWLVAGASLTLLLFIARHVDLEQVTSELETPLLVFFISLFIVIGGVEHSGLLTELGNVFQPIIVEQPLLAAIGVLWVAALLSAMIDNIPFTAAMIPVLVQLQNEGVDVSVIWWALAMGVGMGGNGSHIGSTANVYIVTISERLARQTGDPSLAITAGTWFRKGTPAMLATLVMCTIFIWLGYDYLAIELPVR